MLLILVLAQTEAPSPYLYVGGAASLILVGLGFVLRGFRVVNSSIGGLEDHVERCEKENGELRHKLGWERHRVNYLAGRATRAGESLPTSFWADPGPPGTPYPMLEES